MIALPEKAYFSPEEYLEWEAHQEIKHEYINGEVFAMTGGTLSHNAIAVNLTTALRNNLRGGPCRVYMADAKLGISESGPFHYPDVMVTCDERDRDARQVIYHPCLIVEVLSPTTEGYDRGKKFINYRRIDTLREYILISAEEIQIECFRLNNQGKWELQTYTEGDTFSLESINFHCPISEIYEDVVFASVTESAGE
jgi:Uma2 family endonuclease